VNEKVNIESMALIMKALKQLVLPVLMMFIFHHELHSQEADSSAVVRPGFYVGISMGAGQSKINHEGVLSVSGLAAGTKNDILSSLDVGYFFTPVFGISSGISYTSYRGQITLDSYQNKFTASDSENETYERRVSGKNITEDQNIGFLGIPVCLNLRLPAGKTLGLFLQAGLNFAFPVNKKFTSNGTFTYKGYYPAYNVLLEDLPAYGFPGNAAVRSEGTLNLNPVCFEAIASAGFDILISKKFQLLVAAAYNQSLTSIADYPDPEKFQLSTDVNQINSMMGGSNKTTVQSMGLKISLRYFLKAH
jgi:hypothetical protein